MCQMKLTLSNPVIISQAPPDIKDWGPWQFPLIEKLADGSLHTQFHIHADSATSYGKSVGHAVSIDNGNTWEIPEKENLNGGVLCSNGDRLKVKAKLSLSEQENSPNQEPLSIIQCYASQIKIYKEKAFSKDTDGWFFERLKFGTDTWQEEQADVHLPGKTRYTTEGVLPRPSFWRLKKDPKGRLWGISYPFLDINETTLSTSTPIFCISEDNGHTFKYLSHIEYQPDPSHDPLWDKRNGFSEPDITFLPGGSIYCLLRTTDGNGLGPTYFCVSTDDGKSWTKPAFFDNIGVWPTLLTLQNGVTLAGYGRTGLFVRATADSSCKNWDDRIPIIPLGEYQTDTCSYCDLIALDNHTAYIVYSDFKYPNQDGIPVKSILGRKITTEIIS